MFGKVSSSAIKPLALGVNLQSSTYGQTIPVILGMSRSQVYIIWQGSVTPVSGTGKKGTPLYGIPGNFLLCHNPAIGTAQWWSVNLQGANVNYPMYMLKYSTPIYEGFTGGWWDTVGTGANSGSIQSISVAAGGSGYAAGDGSTINTGDGSATVYVLTVSGGAVTSLVLIASGSDYAVGTGVGTTVVTGGGDGTLTVNINSVAPELSGGYIITGITLTVPYSATFTDYRGIGYPALMNSVSGAYELPLWNLGQCGPDMTRPSELDYFPYLFWGLWAQDEGETALIWLPEIPEFGPYAINVYGYYLPINQQGFDPLSQQSLTFEYALGNNQGGEYTAANLTDQEIVYPEYCGLGGQLIQCSSGGALSGFSPEVVGSFGVNPTGDADFPDMLKYIFKSGFVQAGFFPFGQPWIPGIPYRLNETITDSNGNQQIIITPGISGLTEPVWNTSPEGPTDDGTAVWLYVPDVGSLAHTPLMIGLGCFDYPGVVAARRYYPQTLFTDSEAHLNFPHFRGLTIGHQMIFFLVSSADTTGFSDGAGNTWEQIANQSVGGKFINVYSAPSNGVNFGPSVFEAFYPTGISTFDDAFFFEVAGCDTIAQFVNDSGTGGTVTTSVTTTNNPYEPAYLLAIFWGTSAISSLGLGIPDATHWKILYTDNLNVAVFERIVYFPGTYSITNCVIPSVEPWTVNLMAFDNSQPPSYSQNYPDILDDTTMQLWLDQCRANGLWGSLAMDSQKKASDWLEDICTSGNCAAVWSGFKLKTIPRSEVSVAGNGAIYYAPTSAGPVANIPESDVLDSTTITRKGQTSGIPDLLQIQFPDRAAAYADSVVSQPMTSSLAALGVRKANPKVLRTIQDPNIASQVLGIEVRKQNLERNTYKQKISAKWKLLEPFDLVTINDQFLGITALPVRILSIAEDDSFNLDCEFEEFIYGLYAPTGIPATELTQNTPISSNPPGSVNVPIIFEAVPSAGATFFGGGGSSASGDATIVFIASGGNPNYGGCNIWMSTDGSTYGDAPIATINGNGVQGFLSADYPASIDPDDVDTLSVDLSESLGTMQPNLSGTQNQFTNLSYIAGGGPQGTLLQVTVDAGGTGYVVDDVLTLVEDVAPSGILTVVPTTGQIGTGYIVGDVVSPIFGTPVATLQVTSVNGSGGVTGLSVTTPGGGYFLTSNVTTTGGTGVNLEIDITALVPANTGQVTVTQVDGGAVTAVSITTPGTAYVEGTGIPTTGGTGSAATITILTVGPAVPYELVATGAVVMTGVYQFDCDEPIRRAVRGAPDVTYGVDHPTGSAFGYLQSFPTLYGRVQIPPTLFGQVLYFKFQALNTFGNQLQPLSACTPYPFTPTGQPATTAGLTYSEVPYLCLTQPTATTIDMAQTQVTFPTGVVNYNARTFTIPTPVGTERYEVVIYDPNFVGDTGAATNLVAYCTLDGGGLVGAAGYTYMGLVEAVSAGDGDVGPGGWPPIYVALPEP